MGFLCDTKNLKYLNLRESNVNEYSTLTDSYRGDRIFRWLNRGRNLRFGSQSSLGFGTTARLSFSIVSKYKPRPRVMSLELLSPPSYSAFDFATIWPGASSSYETDIDQVYFRFPICEGSRT